jgi:hypothetical protein
MALTFFCIDVFVYSQSPPQKQVLLFRFFQICQYQVRIKMSFPLTEYDFKSLIKGTLRDDVFRSISYKPNWPSIYTKLEDNKIIVRGDFELSQDITFQKDEIYPYDILLDGGTYKNIIFRGGTFTKLFFRRGIYNGYVSIRGGAFKSLMLLGGSFNHWLGTIDGIKNRENGQLIADEPLYIGRFEIEGGSYANNIWISGGKIESLEVKCVTPVKIHCKPNDDKLFDLANNSYKTKFNSAPDITNLLISRYSNKDNFYHFSELKLDTLKFENFTNIGNITVAQIILTKDLCFENSDLGKTTFIDCDFSKQRMFFSSSKITEIALAGTRLPGPTSIEIKQNKANVRNRLFQQKLALSQIKKVYQNMGDTVTAAEYQAHELETYRQSLDRGGEKFNLWLNKYSNNYGQSWSRAFVILLVGSLIFYSAYCIALGFTMDFSVDGLKLLGHNMSLFLEFLNPIRKSDFLPKALASKEEVNVNAAVYIIDSLAKIFNAYLIYQFIAAFRKHGKKSE